MHGVKSDTIKIKTDFPPASPLGPVLGLLNINDIINIPNTPHRILYADDTNVFYPGNNLMDIEFVCNNCLGGLSDWLLPD